MSVGVSKSTQEQTERTDEKPKKRTALFGLVRRKEIWTFSARGWLAFLSAFLIFSAVFVLRIHPFLAVTDRVDAKYLVVEGWIPNYGLQEAINEFKSKPYQMIFTVGTDPLIGVNIEKGDSLAIEAYKRLQWLGVDPKVMQAVPADVKYRNRTFQSAVALRNWAETNHVSLTSFNLVTLGPHARRSRLLFEKAFQGRARVGIISVEDREYEPNCWWKYSEGLREVVVEAAGYFYVRLFFHPDRG